MKRDLEDLENTKKRIHLVFINFFAKIGKEDHFHKNLRFSSVQVQVESVFKEQGPESLVASSVSRTIFEGYSRVDIWLLLFVG